MGTLLLGTTLHIPIDALSWDLERNSKRKQLNELPTEREKIRAAVCPKWMIKQNIPSEIPAENTWDSEAVSTDTNGPQTQCSKFKSQ